MVEGLKQTFIHIKTPKGQDLSRQLTMFIVLEVLPLY